MKCLNSGSMNRERIWIAISSTNPDFKVGDTIVPGKTMKLYQRYINIEKGEEYSVTWKFLCYREDLSNTSKRERILKIVQDIKNGKNVNVNRPFDLTGQETLDEVKA